MVLCLAFLALLASTPSARASEAGKVLLFRWNFGYRVESSPALERPMTEAEFRRWAETGQMEPAPGLYRGCYLATFQPSGRAPASAEAPVAWKKVCIAPRKED
jgi:hypothetical protein